MSYWDEKFDGLIGKKITRIRMSEEYLVFDTDEPGEVTYVVEGDCCSGSYFFDFYGVRNLLDCGPVTAFEAVDLSPGDPGYRAETFERGVGDAGEWEYVQAYGYRITVEHPQFGPVSAILSFRNSSNGYYGGMMYQVEAPHNATALAELVELTEDKVGE